MSYKSFAELCDVPDEILDFLNYKFDIIKKSQISTNGSKGYMQWQNQIENVITENPNENVWKDNDFKIVDDFFSQYVSKIFRFRFSLLMAPFNVEWHEPHVYPRIHIPLNNNDAVFQLKESIDSAIIETPSMVYGKAYLVDVTLLHRVVSKNSKTRKNAFFCFDNFVTPELEEKYKLSP